MVALYNHQKSKHKPHPKEPKDVVLFLSKHPSISIARESITKQPEAKSTTKYIDVFLNNMRMNLNLKIILNDMMLIQNMQLQLYISSQVCTCIVL